ncbi:MAG: hypothetical protein KC503_35525 [Myxococcales bacterium]|nr:hypothetical protein [Myxococcales bacterium]
MRRLMIVLSFLVLTTGVVGCYLHHPGYYEPQCRTQCERWSTRHDCYHSCSVYRDGYCIVRRRVCRDTRYCVRRVRYCQH